MSKSTRPGAKELLDAHYSWPAHYTFRFILPETELPALRRLFADVKFSSRRSEKGKYVALNFTLLMDSSDAVLEVYAKTQGIRGLIAL